MGLRTVFIPDSDWDGTGLDGFGVDREASTDLPRRARLYASARLNLAVNNGPTALMWAMPQARLLQFKMVVDGAPCCSPSFFASQGLPVGSQPGRPGHRIVWADDDAVRIVAEVMREIEGHGEASLSSPDGAAYEAGAHARPDQARRPDLSQP
jgi:hypothetical protein